MGTVFTRYKTLRWHLQYKDAQGKWVKRPTDFYGPEQEGLARKLLAKVDAKIAAGVEHGEAQHGPMTVARWVEQWEKTRTHEDADNERRNIKNHVLPVIGPMLLADVRPRHIESIVVRLRQKGRAPKTVRNVYTAVRAFFHTAVLHDLVSSDPCILKGQELGRIEDKVAGWRATAVYTRPELERLISDPVIPWDRQMLYALEGIGALRHGEAAGLQWLHYDPTTEPLGRLTVARSYNKPHTKTRRTRLMPVHPVLAAMLAEWKLHGWPAMIGREPKPEDLILPAAKTLRTKLGTMRTKNYSEKLFKKDLIALKLRHRRGHDLRRTMISLARSDGARRDILELCTHTPKKDAAIDMYTTIEWPSLCAEVAKMRVTRRGLVEVVELPKAAGDNRETTPQDSDGLVPRLSRVDESAAFLAAKVVEAPGIEPSATPLLGKAVGVGQPSKPSEIMRRSGRRGNPDGSVSGGQSVGTRDKRDKAVSKGVPDPVLIREGRRLRAGRLLRQAVPRALAGDEEGTTRLLEEAAQLLVGSRRR
jgi:integrase